MAKQRRKKAADTSAFAEGAKVEGLDDIAKLANSAATANAAKGIGHNSGGITDDELKRLIEGAESTKSDMDIAQAALDKARGAYRASLKVAKDKGAPKDEIAAYLTMKKLRQARGDGVVVTEQRNLARILRVMGDPLYTQWSLFEGEEGDPAGTKAGRKVPEAMDAELQGQHAAHNEEPLANNPFVPGTENFALFEQGWKNAERAKAMPPNGSGGAAALA